MNRSSDETTSINNKTLSDLPKEILFHISTYLSSIPSLSNFLLTNKYVYNSFSDKDLWLLSDIYHFQNDIYNFPNILPNTHQTASKWSHVINWESLSSTFPFTDDQIRYFSTFINFNVLFCHQKLSETIIREYMHFTSFDYILLYQKVSCEFLDDFVNEFSPWTSICTYQKLTEDFMRRHSAFLNWSALCRFQSLSTSFINDFSEFINWEILTTRPLTESIIEQNLNRIPMIGWSNISESSYLSDEFIIKHKDKLYFLPILRNRLLQESTLHELQYDMNWYLVCKFQKMSLPFLLSHRNNLHYAALLSNPHIPRAHIYSVYKK